MQENNTENTLKCAKWLLGIGVLLIIVAPYVLTKKSFFEWANFMNTGPIGDTIGGITAPFVNLVAAGLVFLALRAQVLADELIRDQIEDQKAQRHADLINQAIQTQITRIDESVRIANFVFANSVKPNATGYDGLLEFNETFERQKATSGYSFNDQLSNVSHLVNSNNSPLVEIYEKVSVAVDLIDKLMKSYKLGAAEQEEWRRILRLNLGESFRVNVDYIAEYIDWYTKHHSFQDKIFGTDAQINQLSRLIKTVQDFYDKTPLQDT